MHQIGPVVHAGQRVRPELARVRAQLARLMASIAWQGRWAGDTGRAEAPSPARASAGRPVVQLTATTPLASSAPAGAGFMIRRCVSPCREYDHLNWPWFGLLSS